MTQVNASGPSGPLVTYTSTEFSQSTDVQYTHTVHLLYSLLQNVWGHKLRISFYLAKSMFSFYLFRIFIWLTVLPAKSDSDVMFCLQCYRDVESIYHLCINPICRIGLIHK